MEIETVKNIAIVYERAKFRNTGKARIIIGRKNPEKSVNFESIKNFNKNCLLYNILPNFYFESLYDKGNKTIQTKPECLLLNKKTTLFWYKKWLKNNGVKLDSGSEKDVVKTIVKSRKNIDIFLSDNNIENKEDLSDQFFVINLLGRTVKDWQLMLQQNLISPFFIFSNPALLPFSKFIKDFNIYQELFDKYNKNDKLKELLLYTFEDVIKILE